MAALGAKGGKALVPGQDFCLVRQRQGGDEREAFLHFGHAAAGQVHAPAGAREQRIAAEQAAVRIQADAALRVAGRVPETEGQAGGLDRTVRRRPGFVDEVGRERVELGPEGVGGVQADLGPGAAAQRRGRSDMVVMAVGEQDIGQARAVFGQRFFVNGGVGGRVYDGGAAVARKQQKGVGVQRPGAGMCSSSMVASLFFRPVVGVDDDGDGAVVG